MSWKYPLFPYQCTLLHCKQDKYSNLFNSLPFPTNNFLITKNVDAEPPCVLTFLRVAGILFCVGGMFLNFVFMNAL